MDAHQTQPATELATILEADRSARLAAQLEIQKLQKLRG